MPCDLTTTKEGRIQALLAALDEEREVRLVAEKKLRDSQAQNHSAGHDACWQYETDGQWHPFSPEGNDQMHQAYMAYIDDAQAGRWAHIVAGGVERIVDFEEMIQMHSTTGRRRSIRIATGVPVQWESTAAELLTQTSDPSAFYVEVKDAAFLQVIKQLLRSSGHAWDTSSECSWMKKATVKSVHRVENYHLWRRYQARLRTMREDRAKCRLSFHPEPVALDLDGREEVMTASQRDLDCGEPLARDVDEKILLHGTSWNNADSIVRHGFDHRTCTNGMYGDGVYFAGSACKSHQYSCTYKCGKASPCRCERTLIIARVALGDAYHTSETLFGARKPPTKNGVICHSVVVNPGPIQGRSRALSRMQIHQEFVVYDREQAYPAFVVQYLP